MITTQSATRNTNTKRRASIHTNLFDPNLYQVPVPPQRYRQPQTIHPPVTSQKKNLKETLAALLPENIKEYLPDVDFRVTVLCLVWYVTSSVSSNLTKAILHNFPHPIALTELQFLISSSLCFTFITLVNYLHTPQYRNRQLTKALLNFPEGILPRYLNGNFDECIKKRFLMPCRVVLMTTFPMGIFQFVGHITSHKATSLIPVSLVHSVKALSPILTVMYYRVFKQKRYSPMTYFTLIPLICGVIITCWSTHGRKAPTNANEGWFIVGLSFAFISTIIFVSQNIFAKGILTVKKAQGLLPSKQKQEATPASVKNHSPLQLDKITILFYCSCIGFVLTLPLFVYGELAHFSSGGSVIKDLSLKTLSLVLIHGVTHFFQAMLAFQLIGMLSPVNYSIANIMKRIVIICVALVWESHLSWRQLLGLSMTIFGLYGYDKWGATRA